MSKMVKYRSVNLRGIIDHKTGRRYPWANLGIRVENAPSSEIAMEMAELDWEVRQAPVHYKIGEQFHKVSGSWLNYRSDNGEPLGIVSNMYEIVQNHEAFAFADSLIGEGIRYETVGCMQNGRKIWLLAKMPERKILGDAFVPYILFSNSHDGTRSVKVCMTPIRVACLNMINLAMTYSPRAWSFAHVGKLRDRLKDAHSTLKKATDYMQELEKTAQKLAAEKFSESDYRNFVNELFPRTGNKKQKAAARAEIERFRQCYYADDLRNFRSTKWRAVGAISDYATHAPVKNDSQQEAIFSTAIDGNPLIDRAMKLLLAM